MLRRIRHAANPIGEQPAAPPPGAWISTLHRSRGSAGHGAVPPAEGRGLRGCSSACLVTADLDTPVAASSLGRGAARSPRRLLSVCAAARASSRAPRRRTRLGKCTRARPGREGGRALIVHALLDSAWTATRLLGGSMTAGSAHLNDHPGPGLRPGHDRIRNTFPVQTTDLRRGLRRPPRSAVAARRGPRPGPPARPAAPGRSAGSRRPAAGGRPPRPCWATATSPARPGR